MVFIPGLGYVPTSNLPLEEKARVLDGGMTRAIDRRVMGCQEGFEFCAAVWARLSYSIAGTSSTSS